jgi:hypothetical protein
MYKDEDEDGCLGRDEEDLLALGYFNIGISRDTKLHCAIRTGLK